MIEHNKNFYSLEELKRTRDSLEGFSDNEEVYYFVGAIRYACDEIERLNNIINELHKLIEQDWGYYGSFVYNSRAEFDDEEQVNKFWQDYGKKEIVKKYRDKIKELKGDSSNE